MTGLDFTPTPGAQPALRRVASHTRVETGLLLRNGEQFLLALVIPIGLLVLGRVLGGRIGDLATLAPSVLALAIWSSAFTSLAIATGFERRYGVLERLAATPLGRGGLLAGKGLSVVLMGVLQIVVLTAVAVALGWRPHPGIAGSLVGIALLALAGATFAGLALLLAGRLRAEVTLALANIIYAVLLALGALVVPLERYPAAVRPVLRLLPTAALGEGVRAAALGTVLAWPFVVLALWLIGGALAAWKIFRWTS